MKKALIIFFYLVSTVTGYSQNRFQTLIPSLPVIAGESFQVQYVIGETEKFENFKAPAFNHFRFVSGPNLYSGIVPGLNDTKPLKNFVYTLEAISPGRYIIPGAVATINGKPVKSNDVVLVVISKETAAKSSGREVSVLNSDYLLRPGEDPLEKIRQNLFLKLSVDRTTCYVGEPVLAVFKLYSRLESRSDIVKNPGFYGFTVYDMVNLADKQMRTEMVNGKIFDVHTVRKIQLYPLQKGTFTIDAMEVKNIVEFSRSSVNKKTEQEIAEGILGNNYQDEKNDNAEVFETSMHTDPVVIRVKPPPVNDKPAAYNGAVGRFIIAATVVKNKLTKNEGGFFEITISGKGNFTQLNAPVITWPKGMEGFEPSVTDSLDKNKAPLSGCKKFRYAFVSGQPGTYEIAPVHFSFFDPGSNNYKTAATSAVTVEISNEENKYVVNTVNEKRKESIEDKNAKASLVAGGIVILLVIIVLSYWIFKKNKPGRVAGQDLTVAASPDDGLARVKGQVDVSDKEFCRELHRFIWNYIGQRLNLEGATGKKEVLFSRLKKGNVSSEIVSELQNILADCEMIIFTGAEVEIDKNNLLDRSKAVLEAVKQSLL